MPTKDEIFAAWSPSGSLWSPWVKPVLFAHLPASFTVDCPASPSVADWAPPSGATALVVNLPGAQGVLAGLMYARHGFRPVPLYNALPVSAASVVAGGLGAAVDVAPIAAALEQNASALAALPLRADAPPAFLLDANRGGGGHAPPPHWFDNRSVSFVGDFPSAGFLLSHGLRQVVLVQETSSLPSDLSHTLGRWQEAGLSILLKLPEGAPCSLNVRKPGWFAWVWLLLTTLFGFRRQADGGFGGWVPPPSSGG